MKQRHYRTGTKGHKGKIGFFAIFLLCCFVSICTTLPLLSWAPPRRGPAFEFNPQRIELTKARSRETRSRRLTGCGENNPPSATGANPDNNSTLAASEQSHLIPPAEAAIETKSPGHPRADSTKAGGSHFGTGCCPLSSCDWLDELVEKIWFVESSGRFNPPAGDGGKAGGPLQIHPGVIDDVNFYYQTSFTYEDRHDIEKARQIAKLYILFWMNAYKEEIAARIYNGGPRGWRKESTDDYWRKIEGVK